MWYSLEHGIGAVYFIYGKGVAHVLCYLVLAVRKLWL